MQTATTRTSSPSLRQGLIFGVILGVAQIILSLIGNLVNLGAVDSILSYVLYLGIPFIAGLRASSQTGRVSTGLLAGLWTGLFGSIITSVYILIYTLINIDTIRRAAQSASSSVQITNNLLIIGLIIGIIFVIIVATLFGLAAGSIGGAIGRRNANIPQQTYEESMFQPPPPNNLR